MSTKELVKFFVFRGISTSFSKTAAAPFERVQILLQTQNELRRTGRLTHPYTGTIDCLNQTIQKEGISALWRGQSANLLISFLSGAEYLRVVSYYLFLFTFNKKEQYWKWLAGNLVSTSLISVASSVLLYPFHFAHTQLASDVENENKRQYNGIIDVYKKTIASDGITGLYRGFGISCIGSVLYGCAFVTMSEVVWYLMLKKESFMASFITGWTSATIVSLIGYPMDTISKRMIVSTGTTVKYKNSLDALKKIVRREGFMSLFNGSSAYVLQTIVSNTTWVVYELFKEIVLKKLTSNNE